MSTSKTIINENPRHRPELDNPHYHAYMIRMWEEEGHDEHKIRLTTQDTRTGERKGFTDWNDLVRYLKAAIELSEPITQ
ncbi:MAG: hypothetical protein H6667_15440 [Ardenticatenaceae bacterium]|nr:hypothetical protein [Ardenticatenaceae bacterium]MCB9446046.1 hypothetical protein [Ardenticatenaceae bacterium]